MQKVVPAILTADPAELREGLEVLRNRIKWAHIDIMDGKFVPNTSISIFELGEASQFFNLEIHLMVKNPEKYFEDCEAIGAKRVIFHAEATDNIEGVLKEMKKYSFQRAIAINPDTSVLTIVPYLNSLDGVLIMSVHPGFQKQEFIEDVVLKIAEIKKHAQDIAVSLDGGINKTNIERIFQAGVRYVCVGSAIMKSPNPADALRSLEEMIG